MTYQKRVLNWLMACFNMEICRDTTERNHRFLEEALELVQSTGCTASMEKIRAKQADKPKHSPLPQ